MQEIELTQGQVALVDDGDYEMLNQYKWHALKGKGGFYAARNIPSATTKSGHTYQSMHRLIMGNPVGMDIDHINHDGLDNRQSNLRAATRAENGANRLMNSDNTSGYKGVCFNKATGTWRAGIKVDGKQLYLGLFDTAEQGALAYDQAAILHFGEFALTNANLMEAQ